LLIATVAQNRESVGRAEAGGALLQSRPSIAAHIPKSPGIGTPPGPAIGIVGKPPMTSFVALCEMNPLHHATTSSGTRLSGQDANSFAKFNGGSQPGHVSASILGNMLPPTEVRLEMGSATATKRAKPATEPTINASIMKE
jgi:hypothetical protein